MTDLAPTEPRYAILGDHGATAGPYTMEELRALVETGRAGPDDRILVEGSHQGMHLREVIPDAAEIYGRRKSDRIRKRSDRLAAVEAAATRKSDRLAAVGAAGGADPPPPSQPDPAPRRLPVPGPRSLLGIAAVVLVLVVYLLFRDDTPDVSGPPMPASAIIGTWVLSPGTTTSVTDRVMPEVVRLEMLRQLKGLKLVIGEHTCTVATAAASVQTTWTGIGGSPNVLVIAWAQPHPLLGSQAAFARTPQGLVLCLDEGDWPLQPAP